MTSLKSGATILFIYSLKSLYMLSRLDRAPVVKAPKVLGSNLSANKIVICLIF